MSAPVRHPAPPTLARSGVLAAVEPPVLTAEPASAGQRLFLLFRSELMKHSLRLPAPTKGVRHG
jgi:hypothetical protein